VEGTLATASGTAAMGRGELGVWSVGGELGVWSVGGKLGVWSVGGELDV